MPVDGKNFAYTQDGKVHVKGLSVVRKDRAPYINEHEEYGSQAPEPVSKQPTA